MISGQLAAADGAVNGSFNLQDSMFGGFGYAVCLVIFMSLVWNTRGFPVPKPEKVRRRLGADIEEFAGLPSAKLDGLLTVAAGVVARSWAANWPWRAVFILLLTGFHMFGDYMGSTSWPFPVRFGLPLVVLFALAAPISIFSRLRYRRSLLQELRRLHASSVLSS